MSQLPTISAISAWRHRFWRDGQGQVVVGQAPNLPLVLWVITAVGARVVAKGPWQAGLMRLAAAWLLVWAYLEFTQGTSPFRRCLGAGGIVVSIWGLLS